MVGRISLSAWSIRHVLGPISLPYRDEHGQVRRAEVTQGRPDVALADVPAHIRSTFGVDGMEIPSWYLERVGPDERDSFKRALIAEGVILHNVTLDGRCLGDGNAAFREDDQQQIERDIVYAAQVGARGARVNILPPPIVPGGAAATFDEVVQGLQRLNAVAQREGVQLYIENHCEFTDTKAKIQGLLDAVPGLAFILDTGNIEPFQTAVGKSFKTKSVPDDVIDGEAGYHFAADALPLASLVHVKTFGLHPDGRSRLYDLDRAIQVIADGGYKGVVTIECASFVPDLVYPALTDTVKRLRVALGERELAAVG